MLDCTTALHTPPGHETAERQIRVFRCLCRRMGRLPGADRDDLVQTALCHWLARMRASPRPGDWTTAREAQLCLIRAWYELHPEGEKRVRHLRRIQRATASLEQAQHRQPSDAEVAAALGVRIERLHAWLKPPSSDEALLVGEWTAELAEGRPVTQGRRSDAIDRVSREAASMGLDWLMTAFEPGWGVAAPDSPSEDHTAPSGGRSARYRHRRRAVARLQARLQVTA